MDNQLAKKIKESANQIWLAGLGAWAKAEEEGERLFDTLVNEGETIERYTRKALDAPVKKARKKVNRVKDQAVGGWEKVEKVFDERVSSALRRLNIPTQTDVVKLQKRVKSLEGQIKALAKEGTPPVKASDKKVVKKTTSTPKKSVKARVKKATAKGASATKSAPKKKVAITRKKKASPGK